MDRANIKIPRDDFETFRADAEAAGLSVTAYAVRLLKEAHIARLRDEAVRVTELAEQTGFADKWRSDMRALHGDNA
jgi:hypothetical protein